MGLDAFVRVWRSTWAESIPFLDYVVEIRRRAAESATSEDLQGAFCRPRSRHRGLGYIAALLPGRSEAVERTQDASGARRDDAEEQQVHLLVTDLLVHLPALARALGLLTPKRAVGADWALWTKTSRETH